MYLVDTNAISDLRVKSKINAKVVEWFSNISEGDLYLSVITLMELEKGVLGKERKDKAQGAILRDWLDNYILPTFQDRTLPIDAGIALSCARLHVPDKRAEADSLIAATAIAHGMTVVTRNLKDFKGMGVKLINPWTS